MKDQLKEAGIFALSRALTSYKTVYRRCIPGFGDAVFTGFDVAGVAFLFNSDGYRGGFQKSCRTLTVNPHTFRIT